MRLTRCFTLLLATVTVTACRSGDLPVVDPDLARSIAAIKAIDNHAHPVRPTAPGVPVDTEFDALPVDSLEPQSDPVRQRGVSPVVGDAHKRLFGTSDKATAMREHGDNYAAWLLDRIGIETMLSNRVVMGARGAETAPLFFHGTRTAIGTSL